MNSSSTTEHQALSIRSQLAKIVGERNVIQEFDSESVYLTERRGKFSSAAMSVVFPGSAHEVSAVVDYCCRNDVSIVPQGGNTGVCGGAVSTADSIILNLKRMNRVRRLDAAGYSMEVEAGCILANVQAAAMEKGHYFPLSLGAEGTCQIGGNLSTNAGGVNVLRYGNARDLVLGIEVVLPEGSVWNGLNALRKNNTGYDLKNLFIGAEGTLGIITAAVLKLFPAPQHRSTALIAVDSIKDAVELFSRTRKDTSDFASSFELMSRVCVESAVDKIPECRDFFAESYPWYVLLELSDSTQQGISRELNEEFLEKMFSQGLILDAVLAQSEQQAFEMWRLREAIVEAQNYEGKSIKNDVSVPLSEISTFVRTTITQLESLIPDVRCFVYGHIGDGNIHFNISQPRHMDGGEFFDRWYEVTDIVHEIADRLDGSFSAEHGIGLLKTEDMKKFKSATELNIMHSIKTALDVKNIMNPGKVLPSLK